MQPQNTNSGAYAVESLQRFLITKNHDYSNSSYYKTCVIAAYRNLIMCLCPPPPAPFVHSTTTSHSRLQIAREYTKLRKELQAQKKKDKAAFSGTVVALICCLLSAVLSVLSALCSLLSALCSLLSAICYLLSAICYLPSAVCPLLSALCCV
jgi:hypothetical protein